MNSTQGPSETAEQQSPSTGPDAGPTTDPGTPPPGVDRQHLRNYERLHRSTTDRKVAGVAGGLGRHLNIDPTILRVLFVVMCFFGGAGFLLYGVAWLIVPEDGRQEGKISTGPSTRNVLLIGAAVLAALLLLGDGAGGIGFPWPLFLVGIVVVVYLLLRGDRPAGAPGVPAASYAPVDGPPAPPAVATGYALPAYQPPPRKRGPLLFGPTLALVAVALGGLGLYDAAGGSVVDPAYPALALAVVGVMLLLGAFVGRAGGLVLLGLVATFALIVTSIVGNFSGVAFRDGQRVSAAPATAAGVQPSYDIGNGRAVVDLSDVRNPRALDGRTIDVSGRAGELVVVLPQGVRSTVTADISGPGQVDLPDDSSGGFSTGLTGQYGGGTAAVTIHTRLSAGHIDVRNP